MSNESQTNVNVNLNLTLTFLWATATRKADITDLEYRQTLRACDFPCDLQIEIEN